MNVSFKAPLLVFGLTGALITCSAALAQSDPTGFVQVLPGEVKWAQNPALPAGGKSAVLLGEAGKPGNYLMRTKFPGHLKLMPHTHPDNRTYTVLSGTWKMGFGDKFDPKKLKTFPAGSVFTLPANVAHFNETGSAETTIQINSIGPTSTDFVNLADDPRKK